MAYSTNNPPVLVNCGGIGGVAGQKWFYSSADAAADVDTDGYFSNAEALGMRAGDKIAVEDTSTTPNTYSEHYVRAINADGSADVLDALASGNTDTD